MRRVAVIGIGITKFGEHWEKGFRDLVIEAGKNALEDANVQGEEIDALFVGAMSPGLMVGQEHAAALVADYIGLNPIPATRVEGACASGGLAFRNAYMAVASGMHDIVVAGGAEKMTDLDTAQISTVLGGAGDEEWELFQGATFPAIYALMAKRHMHEYHTREEDMALVSVKNHKHASMNDYAQFQKEITVEEVLESKTVSSPLKLLDCSPITDGAAVVVLAELEKAKKYTDTLIEVIGSGQASGQIALHDRQSITQIDATRVAAEKALKQAKVTHKDIDLVEVHDCFTIAEILALEDLGFFKKGEAVKAIRENQTYYDGSLPVNTSGGLKGCGHPVGATGIKQIVEVAIQLRNQAGKRQVKNAEIGMTHNVGGSGATAVVHILKRIK
ncbi:MAG: thiolase domain-containing protein [Candidatus Micrarchaeota archaeon]|nr:thiolase domain-containing protein [Candidatus Micrarchaeota archaeon]